MFNLARSPISWCYLFGFSFIATSFLDERVRQKTVSLEVPSLEERIDGQTPPPKLPSSRDASCSSGTSLDPKSRENHQIPREDIGKLDNAKVIIPDLNEPYIDDSIFPSSEWRERDDRMMNDALNIPLSTNTLASEPTSSNTDNIIRHTDTYHLASNLNKNSRKKHKQIPAFPQSIIITTPSGIGSQPVITHSSESSEEISFIGNVKLKPNVIRATLQWQSRLALGKKFGLSEDIQAYFETLKASTLPKISDKLKRVGYDKEVELSLDRIRTDFVLGVLGSLKITFTGVRFLPSMGLLLNDAWDFLKDYLDRELMNVNHEELLKSIGDVTKSYSYYLQHGNLMTYMLCLSKHTIIATQLLFQVLKEWKVSSTYKESLSNVPLDFETFLVKCESLYQERGEGQVGPKRKQKQNSAESQAVESSPSINSNIPRQDKSPRMLGVGFSRSIRRSGKEIILAHKSQEIKDFFSHLKEEMLESFEEYWAQIDQPMSSSTNKDNLNWNMVERAITVAHDYITPSFIGLLGLMHPEMTRPQAWDNTFESGWKFLKYYFSTWNQYVSETTHPISLKASKKSKAEIEWSNVKETIYYLCGVDSNNSFPQRPIWYLVESWYDSIKSDSSTIFSNLNVLYPHRQNIIRKSTLLDDQRI
ncbi:hypothetical protein DFH28DRAFT_1051538 [Melampsora americana]|nr:hypothetical protein DFH28DRAFT_1051538 [Melampsora americana]